MRAAICFVRLTRSCVKVECHWQSGGSNNDHVDDLLQRDFVDKSVGEDSFKVLGMLWLAAQDCFSFDGLVVSSDLCITKRLVLSLISRLFDPLGFLTPFIMVAKCLFQEIWRLGLSWDEVMPVEMQSRFVQWIKGLAVLRSWKIPRSYTGAPWRDGDVIQLHGFGDASQSAYGACVYIHVKLADGTWKTSLVMARARVAPLKRLSLPRLELLGALLCARLLVYVKQALRLPDGVICYCWTDSTVALAWIQSDPHRWKPFVGNRVAEIQSLSSPSQWRHLSTEHNPADLVTRGISAEELITSQRWLHGPVFLCELWSENKTILGRNSHGGSDVTGMEEARKMKASDHLLITVALEDNSLTLVANHGGSELHVGSLLTVNRWSSLIKAMRVVGWLQRFLYNCKVPICQRKHGNLSFEELSSAKFLLVKHVQEPGFWYEFQALRDGRPVAKGSSICKLSPFLGDDGLLRVQGRLQFTGLSYESTHPIIIPKGHLALLLARQAHASMKHAGVSSMLIQLRHQYWIIGARRICKRVKRECMPCQRLDAPPGTQTMAPLPEMRVKQAPPFSVTELDHAGPLYCCDYVRHKFYVLLFTCAVTRAVHLELVDSTVMALRRFIARRGMPSVVMSDNAKGFIAAKDYFLKVLGPEGPDWKLSVPRAPWWGGWRLVRSVKSGLKRSLGKRSLTRVKIGNCPS